MAMYIKYKYMNNYYNSNNFDIENYNDIKHLICPDNILINIPILSNNLEILHCYNNKLTKLQKIDKVKDICYDLRLIKFISKYNKYKIKIYYFISYLC